MRKEISNDGKWLIEFETNNEKFYLSRLNEGNKEEYGDYDSYEKTEKAINRAETVRKKKITPLSFIKQEIWGGNNRKGKITSLAQEDVYGLHIWVSVDKIRSKESAKGVLKDIPVNEEIIQKIKELQNSIVEERKKYVYYTEKELRMHFEAGETK